MAGTRPGREDASFSAASPAPTASAARCCIKTFTERPQDVAAYGPLDDGGVRTFTVEAVRATGKGVVARLAGVRDRTAAEALRGTPLYVDRDRLPPPAEGEFYHADLIGLAAVDAEGRTVGEVVGVYNHGAGDILEVRLAESSKTEFVAFTDAFVPEVDSGSPAYRGAATRG